MVENFISKKDRFVCESYLGTTCPRRVLRNPHKNWKAQRHDSDSDSDSACNGTGAPEGNVNAIANPIANVIARIDFLGPQYDADAIGQGASIPRMEKRGKR